MRSALLTSLVLALLGTVVPLEDAAFALPGADASAPQFVPEASATDVAPATTPLLQTGDCKLAEDPESGRSVGFIACIRARAGAEYAIASGAPKENLWLRYGEVDGGIFMGEWISLQGRGYERDLIPLGTAAPERQDRTLDYAVVQFGNPAVNRVWTNFGRMRLPFGVDQSFATEFYRSFEDLRFWASPPDGASISWDNLRNLRLDLGYGTDTFTDESLPGAKPRAKPAVEPTPAPDPSPDNAPTASTPEGRTSGAAAPTAIFASSVRLMFDFPALDGSRLVFSGYGENRGARRGGFGFLTTSRHGDQTRFEWVRLLTTPDGKAAPFAQLIRAGYLGAWRKGNRVAVQIDDERLQYRMGTIGGDFLGWDHLIARLAITYYKSETGDDRRRWYLTTGLEVDL